MFITFLGACDQVQTGSARVSSLPLSERGLWLAFMHLLKVTLKNHPRIPKNSLSWQKWRRIRRNLRTKQTYANLTQPGGKKKQGQRQLIFIRIWPKLTQLFSCLTLADVWNLHVSELSETATLWGATPRSWWMLEGIPKKKPWVTGIVSWFFPTSELPFYPQRISWICFDLKFLFQPDLLHLCHFFCHKVLEIHRPQAQEVVEQVPESPDAEDGEASEFSIGVPVPMPSTKEDCMDWRLPEEWWRGVRGGVLEREPTLRSRILMELIAARWRIWWTSRPRCSPVGFVKKLRELSVELMVIVDEDSGSWGWFREIEDAYDGMVSILTIEEKFHQDL